MANGDTQETKKSAKDRSKNQLVLAMDADRLGLAAGALVATLVMGVSFLQEADGIAVSFRTGLAFVGTYSATFFFIRIFLRSTLYELVIEEKDKTRAKLGRGKSSITSDDSDPEEAVEMEEEISEGTTEEE